LVPFEENTLLNGFIYPNKSVTKEEVEIILSLIDV
jgi:hypothetical protein